MLTINPYLNFLGNTEEAFNFYRAAFGGEFAVVQRYKDTPEAGKVSAEEGEKIMHMALPIGKGNVLMGTDTVGSMAHQLVTGNSFQLSVSTGSEEETTRLFNALSADGVITMPLAKTFWGAFFGMFTDKFGIKWMISYDENHAAE